METLYIIVLYVKYVCFLFRVLLETIISKMEDLVLYFFLKKVLLSEYSTDYVGSSYMYLINILL